jgi:O-antigen ligase
MPRNLTGLLYLALLILLPFAYSKSVIDPALMPRQILLGLFVILLVVLILLKKTTLELPQWKNPLPLAIGSYLFFSLVGFTTNTFTSESHAVLSKFVLVFGFLFLTVSLLKGKAISVRDVILSGIAFGIVAIGSAAVQLFQKSVIGHQKLFRQIEIIDGLFANKNLLASVLFLCLPFFAMGLPLSRRIKWLSIFGIAGAVFILLVIRTRTVFAAMLVMAAVLLYFYLRSRFKIRHSFLVGSAVILAIGLFLVVKTPKEIDSQAATSISKHYATRVFETRTLDSRTDYWKNSFGMLKDNLVFGVGYGNWQVEFPKYGLEKLKEYGLLNGTQTLQRAHNDFLQVLCESGIVGFICYILIFWSIAYQLVMLIWKSQTTAEKWRFVTLLGGVSGFVVIAALDFPMERIEHLVLLMLIFAIITFSYEEMQPAEPTSKNNLPIYIMLAAAVYSVIVAGFRYQGEKETVKMYAARAAAQWNDVLYYANAAQSKFYQIDPTSIPIDWYKGNAYFGRGELAESIAALEKAYAIAPYQIQVINNLATAYRASGQNDKAEKLYLEALGISPGFEEARFNLAALYFSQQKFSQAFETIDKVSIDTKDEKYAKMLVPILAKEINRILAKHNNLELSTKVAAKITKSEQIIRLYRNAKREKMSFEAYVTDPNGVFE